MGRIHLYKKAFSKLLLFLIIALIIILLAILKKKEPHLRLKHNVTYNESGWENKSYLWRPISTQKSSELILNDRIAEQFEWTKKFFERKKLEDISTKNILLVFGYYRKYEFWATENKIQCPGFSINETKCKLSLSNSLIEENINVNNYDAIIYTEDYWPIRQNLNIPDKVKQIFYMVEAPVNSLPKYLRGKSLLASYFIGSDIVIPYFKWISFGSQDAKYLNMSTDTRNDNLTFTTGKNYAEGKSGLVVMFSSNCNVYNNRFGYIQELKKFISVDVFGKCGVEPPCSNGTERNSCLRRVTRRYKFYLSFENTNCRGYITEKFFGNALQNDLVPVVMGAHPDDYRHSAPPHSYIHVDDFQSPKHLSEYLQILDKNDKLYNEYFQWKGTGDFYGSFSHLFCRVCGMMFYYDYVPPQHTWAENETWASVDTCLPFNVWNWNSH